MWIATNFGWFSTVEDRDDSEKVYVRARDLTQLSQLTGFLDFETIITTNNSADYRYRIHITKQQFKKLVSDLVDHIDYDNFKNSIKDKTLYHALTDVWSVMYHAFADR
jgi:hypothetical protein